MFDFGAIMLVQFPFTDLSGTKRRPALVVSRNNAPRTDVVVAFITAVPREGADLAPIEPTPGTGLKVPSVVRFDKIATLDKSIFTGRLGQAPNHWIRQHASTFFGVFGFTPVPESG